MITLFVFNLILCAIKIHSNPLNVHENFIDFRLSDVLIPQNLGDGTVYVCQEFEMPVDETQVYELVKFKALVDPFVHHIILFACDLDAQIEPTKPHMCSQSSIAQKCLNWLAQWSLGMNETINLPREASYKIGSKHATRFHLQIHLHTYGHTNVTSDTFLEKSGFRLFYANEKRKYDVGNVQIGQETLLIPADTRQTLVKGGCSQQCLSVKLQESKQERIYLTRIYLHMHNLGVSAELSVMKRNSSEIHMIASDQNYNYAKPKVNEDMKQIEIEQGDRLILECFYNSKDDERFRSENIKWGEGVNAEMCYAFITYYPRLSHFNKCIYRANYDQDTSNNNAYYFDEKSNDFCLY